MVNRNRGILLKFYVSEKELEQIRMKMEQYSTNNLSAYLRKIAIDGYVVNLELPELGEMVSLLRRSSNNLNQLPSVSTKRAGSMTPIWRTCGGIMRACGRRRRKFYGHWQKSSERPTTSLQKILPSCML